MSILARTGPEWICFPPISAYTTVTCCCRWMHFSWMLSVFFIAEKAENNKNKDGEKPTSLIFSSSARIPSSPSENAGLEKSPALLDRLEPTSPPSLLCRLCVEQGHRRRRGRAPSSFWKRRSDLTPEGPHGRLAPHGGIRRVLGDPRLFGALSEPLYRTHHQRSGPIGSSRSIDLTVLNPSASFEPSKQLCDR